LACTLAGSLECHSIPPFLSTIHFTVRAHGSDISIPWRRSHGFGKVSKLSDESAQEREFPQPRQGDFAFGILLALLRVAVLLGEGYAHLWRLSNIWLFRVVWGG
jgi:hypothetical protein